MKGRIKWISNMIHEKYTLKTKITTKVAVCLTIQDFHQHQKHILTKAKSKISSNLTKEYLRLIRALKKQIVFPKKSRQ